MLGSFFCLENDDSNNISFRLLVGWLPKVPLHVGGAEASDNRDARARNREEGLLQREGGRDLLLLLHHRPWMLWRKEEASRFVGMGVSACNWDDPLVANPFSVKMLMNVRMNSSMILMKTEIQQSTTSMIIIIS